MSKAVIIMLRNLVLALVLVLGFVRAQGGVQEEDAAVDVIHEDEFSLKPQEVITLLKSLGYEIVVAPDPTLHHPVLFHCIAQRYTVLQRGELVHPQITVVVGTNTVTMTYRRPIQPTEKKMRALHFCNEWNFKHRYLNTCFLDDTNFVNLVSDVELIHVTAHSDVQGGTCRDAVNRVLVERGEKRFREKMITFAQRLTNYFELTDGPHHDL